MRGVPRVLFVTPELAPWAKAGGLGEVGRELPQALAAAGADIRVLVPAYPGLLDAFPRAPLLAEIGPCGGFPPARLRLADGPVPILLLDCPPLYARPGVYQDATGSDWGDNHLRFGLLSRVAAWLATAASPLAWRPHVLHCHDWPSGLAPLYLACEGERTASVFTIHNLGYQGLFAPGVLSELGIPDSAFTLEGAEFYGKLSFLKAGIRYATRLTTVSPSYAREIQEPRLGFGLDGLLRSRGGELAGILNGIAPEAWDPRRDPLIARNYDGASLELKLENKLAAQRAFGLRIAPECPLLAFSRRLVWQKGVDLLLEAGDRIAAFPAQLVVLGQGERGLEEGVRALAARHPGSFAAQIGFEDRAAHLLLAGADLVLMPSRYEPCGLTQLQAMRYGTLPVAHRTGGLADSIVDAGGEGAPVEGANGFTTEQCSAAGLVGALARALAAYRDRPRWRALQRNAMARESGWARAVASYLEVYRAACGRPRAVLAPSLAAAARASLRERRRAGPSMRTGR